MAVVCNILFDDRANVVDVFFFPFTIFGLIHRWEIINIVRPLGLGRIR